MGEVAFGTITAGRAPVTANEIALGQQTMERTACAIGDEIDIAKPFEPDTIVHV